VVEGFRWVLLNTQPPTLPMLALSVVSALIMLISGILFFRGTERTFADII
jgi:lipopolysaccharide transport system permease protein